MERRKNKNQEIKGEGKWRKECQSGTILLGFLLKSSTMNCLFWIGTEPSMRENEYASLRRNFCRMSSIFVEYEKRRICSLR